MGILDKVKDFVGEPAVKYSLMALLIFGAGKVSGQGTILYDGVKELNSNTRKMASMFVDIDKDKYLDKIDIKSIKHGEEIDFYNLKLQIFNKDTNKYNVPINYILPIKHNGIEYLARFPEVKEGIMKVVYYSKKRNGKIKKKIGETSIDFTSAINYNFMQKSE